MVPGVTGLIGAVSAVERVCDSPPPTLLLSTEASHVLARRQKTASNNLEIQLLSFIVFILVYWCTVYPVVPPPTTTLTLWFIITFHQEINIFILKLIGESVLLLWGVT